MSLGFRVAGGMSLGFKGGNGKSFCILIEFYQCKVFNDAGACLQGLSAPDDMGSGVGGISARLQRPRGYSRARGLGVRVNIPR